jgi:hypothetical protein
VTKTQEELLTSSHGSVTLFAHEDPLRLKIADRLAKRYCFFHPMLEFIEVFWLRDGFDIICGNPPWIKLEFDEESVISEKFPEIIIRKNTKPEYNRIKQLYFDKFKGNIELFSSEKEEITCITAFMNTISLYPLLVGQKNNLYKCVLENSFSLISSEGYVGILCPETIYDDPKGQPLRKE